MKTLTRLVYRSESCISHDDTPALDAIFDVSLKNNARNHLTGALALPDGKFVQVIEGTRAAVDALMARLGADDRHSDINILGQWTVTARLFGNWSMARPDPEPLSAQSFRIITEVGSGAQVVGLLINMIDEARQDSLFGVS
jgi:hypothetical protein